MAKGFLSKITYSSGLWILGLVLMVSGLLVSLFYQPAVSNAVSVATNLELFPGWNDVFPWLQPIVENPFIEFIYSLLIILVVAFQTQSLTSDFRLIRVRSFFPFFLVCLLLAAIFPFINPRITLLAGLLMTWSYLRLFSIAEDTDVNRAVFDASFLLSLASLIIPRLAWLLPLMWLATGMVQSFNIRNFFSSLIGFLCTFWIIGAISFLAEDYRFITEWTTDALSFQLIDVLSLSHVAIIFLMYLGLMTLIAIVSFVNGLNQDKLRTRNLMNGMLVIWCALVGLWITSGTAHIGYLMLLIGPTALFMSRYFSLNDNLFSRAMFILLLILVPIVFFYFQ